MTVHVFGVPFLLKGYSRDRTDMPTLSRAIETLLQEVCLQPMTTIRRQSSALATLDRCDSAEIQH
jgi:hypothetical protein